MKIPQVIIRIIFILLVPLFAFSASIALAVNSTWLYTSLFDKYDVALSLQSNGLPVTEQTLDLIARDFVNYFNSGEEYIDLTVTVDGNAVSLFTVDEAEHFKDVKKLFRFDYRVLAVSLVLIISYITFGVVRKRDRSRQMLVRSLLYGGALSIFIMLILGLAALIDFDSLWLQFHYLSFTNTLWSAQGYMLLLFPGGFWYDMVIYCACFAAGIAVILGGASCSLSGGREAV